jgi:hypothetical protein
MRRKSWHTNVLRVKKDLHSLSDVLISLKGNTGPIPYRRSKLAHFLKNEIGKIDLDFKLFNNIFLKMRRVK